MQALIDFDGWRKWKDFSQSTENPSGPKDSSNPTNPSKTSPKPLELNNTNNRRISSSSGSGKPDKGFKSVGGGGKLTLPERGKKRLSSGATSLDTGTLSGSGSEGLAGEEREGRGEAIAAGA